MSEWITIAVLICGFVGVSLAIGAVRDELVRVRRAMPDVFKIVQGVDFIETRVDEILDEMLNIRAAIDPEFAADRRSRKELEAESRAKERASEEARKASEKRQGEWLSRFDKK